MNYDRIIGRLAHVPGDEPAQPAPELPGPPGNAVERPLILRRPEPPRDVCRDHFRLFQPVDQVPPVPQPLDRGVLGRGEGVEEVERQMVADESGGVVGPASKLPVNRFRLF
jgi:hypothetical protein